MDRPAGRDASRGPIPWTREPPHGWTGQPPWLPFSPDSSKHSVQAEQDDPDSVLQLTRRLIRLRASSPALRYGSWTELDLSRGVLAFRRELDDERFVCLINFTDSVREVPLDGDWEIHVDSRAFRGEAELMPYEGSVQPGQALVLAPATPTGREQTDVEPAAAGSAEQHRR